MKKVDGLDCFGWIRNPSNSDVARENLICFQYCFSFIELESWTTHDNNTSYEKTMKHCENTVILKVVSAFWIDRFVVHKWFHKSPKISLVHILQVLDKKRQHVSCFEAQSNTPPQSLTARPWKMVGKEDDPFPIWGPVTFQGLCELAVKLLEGSENLVHLEGPEESRTVETTSHPEEISRPNASLSSLV